MFSMKSHLLQLKSSLQIFRLGFLATRIRCCFSHPDFEEESDARQTETIELEGFLQQSPEKESTLISGFMKPSYKGLADLFREHKFDQTKTAEDQEGASESKEALSDVILDCCAKTEASDSHSEELPPEKQEKDQSVSDEEVNVSSLFSINQFPAESEEIDKLMPPTSLNGPSELSDDPPHKDTESMPDIWDIIGILREKKRAIANSTESSKNKGPVKDNLINGDFLKISKRDNGFTLRDFGDVVAKTEDEEMSDSEVLVPTRNKDEKELNRMSFSRESSEKDFRDVVAKTEDEEMCKSEVFVPTRNKDEKELNRTRFSRESLEKNRVLVRFVHNSISQSVLLLHFHSCGEILDVEFHNAGGSQFRTAYIYFKTKKGLRKALSKYGSILRRWAITVESPSSSMETVKTPLHSLTVDPDIPTSFVKNPNRTIKIEQLTRKISSHHIKEALAFCESNISGYFLGPAHSVAFVEFETELGKERALARQSINILGRQLTMLRIDHPRTTVVRISNIYSLDGSKILSVCRALGGVTQSLMRNYYVMDVHFEFAEWPNMLKILNSLNGYEIEGRRLQAEPAPVFPSDVLVALWQQPDERKLLRATVQGLLRKLGENTFDTSELASLQHEFLR